MEYSSTLGLRDGSALDELPLIHQPALVDHRYSQLDDTSSTQTPARSTTQDESSSASHEFVGILERPPYGFQQSAVHLWTKELRELLSKGESEFVKLLHRRTMVQSEVHTNALSSQQRRKKLKSRPQTKSDSLETNVPAVVRLGVLTMFPLIQALSSIPGANYELLCAQTLDIVIKTLATLPPLALSKEPNDCLDAFKDFISQQIDNNKYQIDSQAKSQALVALSSLAISRGKAQHIFHLIDSLFKVHHASASQQTPSTLPVGKFLRQLVEFNKEADTPVPCEYFEEPWIIDLLSASGMSPSTSFPKSDSNFSFIHESLCSSSIASDGKYLFIHSAHGLAKVGSGMQDTIKGNYYAANPKWRTSDRWSSIACVGDNLYYWSPELSYETCRPKSETNLKSSQSQQNPSESLSSSSNQQNAPLARICPIIMVISKETLIPIGKIRLEDSVLSMQSRMITDGRYLMFVGKPRGKGTKNTAQPAGQQFGQPASSISSLLNQPMTATSSFQPPNFSNFIPSQNGGSGLVFGNMASEFSNGFPAGQSSLEFMSNLRSPQMSFGLYGNNPDQNDFQSEDANNDQQKDDEEDSPSTTSSDDSENEDENDQSDEEEEEMEEDEEGQAELEPVRSPPRSSSRPVRPNIKSKNKEEDGIIANSTIVEWYDLASFPTKTDVPSENLSASQQLSLIPSMSPIRSLELPSKFMVPIAASGSANVLPGDDVLPLNFSSVSFYTNGHHLTAVVRANNTTSFRTFSLVDGKVQVDVPGYNGSIAGKELDGKDCFTYDSISNTIWAFRADNGKCSRFYNMGLTPYYDDSMSDSPSMQVDYATNSKPTFVFPSAPPMSPEHMHSKLDVWVGSKRTRPSGSFIRQQSLPLTTERTLKETLTPFEIIAVIIASLDRLSRHHRAYLSNNLVDESFAQSASSPSTIFGNTVASSFMFQSLSSSIAGNNFDFTIETTPQSLQWLCGNLHHALDLLASPSSGVQPELASYVVLVLVRLLKINLHYLLISGKTSQQRDEQMTRILADANSLMTMLAGATSNPTPAFHSSVASQIQLEACNTICVGFTAFFPTQTLQIEFIKSVVESSATSKAFNLLHNQLMSCLASFYRLHEIFLDDSKASAMEIDSVEQPKPKKSASQSVAPRKNTDSQPLSASLLGSKASSEKADNKTTSSSKELATHPQAVAVWSSLIKRSLSDTLACLNHLKSTKSIEDVESSNEFELKSTASIKLLLAVQMEILSLTFTRSTVPEYFSALTKHVTEFLAETRTQFLDLLIEPTTSKMETDDTTNKELEADSVYLLNKAKWKRCNWILQSSIVGTVLPSLVTGLSRKSHVKDPAFVTAVFDKLTQFIVAFDSFNLQIPSVAASDKLYLLSSTLASEMGSTRKQGTKSVAISSWLLDLQTALALLARKCVVTLLEGEPVSEKERQCQDWLDTRLLNGGIDDDPANVDKIKWLEAFAEGKEGAALYTWLKSQGGPRPTPRPTAKASLERAERYALAAMMKHSGLVADAQEFSKALAEKSAKSSSVSHIGRFSWLAKKTTPLASLLTRRAEMQKTWQLAVQDKVNDFDVFGDLAQHPDRLLDFCEMIGVEANLVNTDETIKRLLQKLQEEIAINEELKKSGTQAATTETGSSLYENLCAPVVERALFLMKLLPSNRTIRHPSADTSNPFSSSHKKEAGRLRASAPGSSELSGRENLIKSTSLLQTTESAQAKAKQRESEDQDSQAFSQRVGELRSWLQAYSAWEQTALLHNRHKKDEPPPTSPIQGVIAFTTNQSITVKDWERVLRVQATRARSREQGLLCMRRLLSTCHFAAPRHQLLGSLAVSHYLDGIQSCGEALTQRVSELFSELFISLTTLIKDTSLDSTSRLLALNVCAFTYTENDAPLLSKAAIFPLLQSIMAENPLSHTERKSPKQTNEGVVIDEQKILLAQHNALNEAAWTCFRLFAAQVVSWIHHDDLHFERAIITQLQQQAFDVFLVQLKTLASKLAVLDLAQSAREMLSLAPRLSPDSAKDFSFELVFLLRLLSETSKAWTSPESIPTLLNFLSSRTAPKAQRIVLRLLRKLLPEHSADLSNAKIVQFCLDEMGKWMFQGKCNPVSVPNKSAVVEAVPVSDSAASPNKPSSSMSRLVIISGPSSELGQPQQRDSLYIPMPTDPNYEQSIFGNPSFPSRRTPPPSQVLASTLVGTSSESTVSKQTQNMTNEECIAAASLRAKSGDIVQIVPVSEATLEDEKFNANLEISSLNPVYWADGGAASMIASEYIALLRYLFVPSNPSWFNVVKDTLAKSISPIKDIMAKLTTSPEEKLPSEEVQQLFRALASLCLVAGFQEPIRVGGKVSVKPQVVSEEESLTGTVVSYSPLSSYHADVIFDSEARDQKTVHSLDVRHLRAIPEIQLEVTHLSSLSESIIPVLLSVIVMTCDKLDQSTQDLKSTQETAAMDVDTKIHDSSASLLSPDAQQNMWLCQEIKSKALSALNAFLQVPKCVDFLVGKCSDKIAPLLHMAKQADPTKSMDQLERKLVSISARLWDVQTIPDDLQGQTRRRLVPDHKGMSHILPHFWNAHKTRAMPTAFDKTSLAPGTIITDAESRSIQLLHLKNGTNGHSGGFSRRGGINRYGGGSSSNPQSGDVVFMFGNCLIPSKGIGEYYFEVSIENADMDSDRPPNLPKPNISIGLVPDPQTSGTASASTSSLTSAYRQSSFRGAEAVVPWPTGSYCYLSNRSKAWVVDNNLRTEGYGEHYAAGSTVGCLWNQNERTIAFTKDGEELDVAFRNVLGSTENGKSSLHRLVPCVSASRGVKITINFGQVPFKYSPEAIDTMDAATREAKRKEAEEKRQKAIQEEMARKKVEQEARDAAFMDDASLLLSMGFSARHALRAMEHAGWTYKNRWPSTDSLMMAANWLTEASPDQLGPAGDLPSAEDIAPAPQAEPKPTKKTGLNKSGSSEKPKSEPKSTNKDSLIKKPLYPEQDYSVTKSSEFVLGDAYSLGAPKKSINTQASLWRKEVVPLIVGEIGFSPNDPMVTQLCSYADAGNNDALKSLLQDLYRGKIPPHIRLPSQLKIVEHETIPLKMTQVIPDTTVTIASLDSMPSQPSLSHLLGRTGIILDRDLEHNLALVQFVSSEDATLEEWWFPVSCLTKDRSTQRPYSDIEDAPTLQRMLAQTTQQFANFAARRVLLSLLQHSHTSFDADKAQRELEDLAKQASSNLDGMEVDNPPKSSAEVEHVATSSSVSSVTFIDGSIDIQDSLQLIAGECLSSPEIIISSLPMFTEQFTSEEKSGMNLARLKLIELISRIHSQNGEQSCKLLLDALIQKCITLLDVSCNLSASKTITFTQQDSIAAAGAGSAPKGSKSSTSAPASQGITSFPNFTHKINIPGARACIVMIHSETSQNTRVNIYLDEDCTELVTSIGGVSELDGTSFSKNSTNSTSSAFTFKFSPGGPYQPALVPSNTFYVKAVPSSLNASSSGYGSLSTTKANLEYKVTVVPASADLSLARWICEFLTFSTIPDTKFSNLCVSIDFNQILNTLIDYLYLSPTPTPIKESIMALLARIIHDLRRRSMNDTFKLCKSLENPVDLSRLNTMKREMISLYDNERRSSSNTDPSFIKKRGSVFSTYLQSLVELMVAFRMYEIDNAAREKLTRSAISRFDTDSLEPDETMAAAVALAQTLDSEVCKRVAAEKMDDEDILGASSSLFDEHSTSPTKSKSVDHSNEEDDFLPSLFVSSELKVPETDESKEKKDLSASGSSSNSSSSGNDKEDDKMEEDDGDYDGGAKLSEDAMKLLTDDFGEMDDDLAAAIAMSVQQAQMEDQESAQKTSENKPIESKEDKVAEDNKNNQKDQDAAPMAVDKPESSDGSAPPPPPPPASTKASTSGALASWLSTVGTPPKASSSSPSQTPGSYGKTNVKKPTTPAVNDPNWFSTLISAAQSLEVFNDVRSPAHLDLQEQLAQYDPVQLQSLKDMIKSAWSMTTSADFIRPRMFLIDNLPTVAVEKRAELITALEELVEEKTLVVEGTFYLPIDHRTQTTKNWAIIEIQSPENMTSFLTFKDPNFTNNKPHRLELIPIKKLLEKPKPKPTADKKAEEATTQDKPAVETDSEAKPIDLHYDEPEPSPDSPHVSVDPRWREYVRSRLWDKKNQQLTREFRDALTETFIRFSTDHTVDGVLGVAQLNELQKCVRGEPLDESTFEYLFSFGTKKHTFQPPNPLHPGKSPYLHSNAKPKTSNSLKSASDNSSMNVDESTSALEQTVEGLTLNGFLTLYTNQSLQEPMETFTEFTNLGFDLHLNRVVFTSLEEAEHAVLKNDFLTAKADLELIRYMEQLIGELDVLGPLGITISQIKHLSLESHLAQLYPRLVKLSSPLLCLRYEMLRQLNQKISDIFRLVNMGSRGLLSKLISDCRGLIFHSLKMNFVYNVLDRTADDSSPCPSVMLNRIEILSSKENVMANRTEELFTKNTAFGQAFSQLASTDPASFRRSKPTGADPHFAMRILFEKENVQGDGGPYRQFFTDISKELAEVLPLLVPCPNAQTKIGNNRDKFVVTPSSNSRLYLRMYRFLGQLMGMAIRTGVMLSIDLPSFFWKPLVGMPPLIQDIRDIDHSFYTVLKYLRTCGPEVFQGETRTIFDHFQTTLSDKSKMLLKPGGDTIEVTYNNRDEYCRLAEMARCNESYMQIHEIRRGLADIIPLSLLNLFTWQDLQWRVCGRPHIDLKLLKRHTEYAGVSPTSPHIRYFWQVLRSFSQEDRRAFVRFAWAQERLPADDQEFARSQTRMMIKQGPQSDLVFPTADTCFFNLSLPVYSSPDIMRERLLFAIHTDGAMDNDRPEENEDR